VPQASGLRGGAAAKQEGEHYGDDERDRERAAG
jgi:hypothetical protein